MNHDRASNFASIMIAVVTIMGAAAACLAATAASNAADADFSGLNAAINAQKAEIINEVNAYEHYRAYTVYLRYLELGNLMYDPNSDEQTSIANGVIQREAWGLASGISGTFFKPRYINPDGTYDIHRELDEAWAEDTQGADLNPAPYFEESDRMHDRSSFLIADTIVLAISFWFLTLGQAAESKIKYLWIALGILFCVAGLFGILIGRFLI